MKRILTTFLSLLIIYHVQAQVDSIWNDQYRTVVELKNSSVSETGQLYQVLDSSIVLMKKKIKLKKTDPTQYELLKLKVSDIDELSIYNNRSVGKSALNGLLIGASIGAVIGLAISGGDNLGSSAGENVAAAGLVFGLVGGSIGAIAGTSAEVSFAINGNQKIFSACRRFIIGYATVK